MIDYSLPMISMLITAAALLLGYCIGRATKKELEYNPLEIETPSKEKPRDYISTDVMDDDWCGGGWK